jgi:hypothetical protein
MREGPLPPHQSLFHFEPMSFRVAIVAVEKKVESEAKSM